MAKRAAKFPNRKISETLLHFWEKLERGSVKSAEGQRAESWPPHQGV